MYPTSNQPLPIREGVLTCDLLPKSCPFPNRNPTELHPSPFRNPCELHPTLIQLSPAPGTISNRSLPLSTVLEPTPIRNPDRFQSLHAHSDAPLYSNPIRNCFGKTPPHPPLQPPIGHEIVCSIGHSIGHCGRINSPLTSQNSNSSGNHLPLPSLYRKRVKITKLRTLDCIE